MLKRIQFLKDVSVMYEYIQRLLFIDSYLFNRFLRNANDKTLRKYLLQRKRITNRIDRFLNADWYKFN